MLGYYKSNPPIVRGATGFDSSGCDSGIEFDPENDIYFDLGLKLFRLGDF